MYQEEETGFEVGNASLEVIDGSRNEDEPRVKLDKIVLFCSRQKNTLYSQPRKKISHTGNMRAPSEHRDKTHIQECLNSCKAWPSLDKTP